MAEIETAVVIGGTSGIGKAIALRFAETGARIVIAGRDEGRGRGAVAEAQARGAAGATFVAVDVADPASIEALAGAVEAEIGIPAVLVNSAGILQSGKHVLDQALDEDERMWRINYRGTLVGCRCSGGRCSARDAAPS